MSRSAAPLWPGLVNYFEPEYARFAHPTHLRGSTMRLCSSNFQYLLQLT